MRIIKLTLVILLIASLAAGGVYAAANRGLLPADILAQINQLVAGRSETLATITSTTQSKLKVLSSEAGNLATQSGVVLGSTVEAETNQPPLPQRAFEFARYSYCQEVVKDYEKRFSTEE